MERKTKKKKEKAFFAPSENGCAFNGCFLQESYKF